MSIALFVGMAAIIAGKDTVPGRYEGRPAVMWMRELGHSLQPNEWFKPPGREKPVEALKAIGPAGLPTYLRALKSPRRKDQIAAVETLAVLGPVARPVVPQVAELLNSPNEEIRGAAADALVRLGPVASAALPALRQSLLVEGGEQRIRVAHAIAAIDRRDLIAPPILIEGLKYRANDPSGNPDQRKEEAVRVAAARALGDLGPRALVAVPALAEAMAPENPDDTFHNSSRNAAAIALGNIGPEAKAAVPALIAALRDRGQFVAESACDSLIAIRPDRTAVPALLEVIKDTRPEFMGVASGLSERFAELGRRRSPTLSS